MTVQRLTVTVANESTTGTMLNHVACKAADGTAINCPITATPADVLGIVAAAAGTTGFATLACLGTGIPCVYDGGTTAGDYVGLSSTDAGNCHAQSTAPSSYLGTIDTTHAAANVYPFQLAVSNGGGGEGGGAAGNVTSGATLSAGEPVIGNGGVDVTSGTRSGNTTEFATSSGAKIADNCAKWDANGNRIDAGTACGGGGGASSTNIMSTAGIGHWAPFGEYQWTGDTAGLIPSTAANNTTFWELPLVQSTFTMRHCVILPVNGTLDTSGAHRSGGAL